MEHDQEKIDEEPTTQNQEIPATNPPEKQDQVPAEVSEPKVDD